MTIGESVPELKLLEIDPWLAPYGGALKGRMDHYHHVLARLQALDGGLMGSATQAHKFFGVNYAPGGVWAREWAPGADSVSLIGDFNGWNRESHPLQRDEWGIWSLFLPAGEVELKHGDAVKLHIRSAIGAKDRLPATIRWVRRDPGTNDYVGRFWNPPTPYPWKNSKPPIRGGLKIYEAHVGMATEEFKIGSYREFADNVLPRIADLGYSAVQLMAIAEHPYYGSFGYHVSNYFAPSNWFGDPDDLRYLVDIAHGIGLRVIMDIVHSHAVKNQNEGLAYLDGTDHLYFHSGARGVHPQWDSMLFDYSKIEVQRFLLSNVRYWLEEFHIDGYRFDGVTSMLFRDHGIGQAFGSYDSYFDGNFDGESFAYLQLANQVIHQVDPQAITIAEDVSGLPGLALPIDAGGGGFDYRMAMGVPDYWTKLLREKRDEDWNLGAIYGTLLNRRHSEGYVGYAESHDQAIVGDKTLAFWLMDAKMYSNMSKFTPDFVVDRGVALHKMIRLITFALAGDAYLSFMGNEFGHPEWIDFPNAQNGYSYEHARRQWSLSEKSDLYYHDLLAFDKAMVTLDSQLGILNDKFIEQLFLHEDTRQLGFRRGPYVFLFNFHATESYASLRVPVPDAKNYRVVLDTDARAFGGHGNLEPGASYPAQPVPMYGRGQSIQVYLPARSAQVLLPE
ncbi:MAG: alpha amylase C-terminal domain-containing protein [Armatimonadetes bacterium]|nr:alpha amylase C-terminal domain-containing protein [Armatimonadota bacterium]